MERDLIQTESPRIYAEISGIRVKSKMADDRSDRIVQDRVGGKSANPRIMITRSFHLQTTFFRMMS